jgi:hypothetical protein
VLNPQEAPDTLIQDTYIANIHKPMVARLERHTASPINVEGLKVSGALVYLGSFCKLHIYLKTFRLYMIVGGLGLKVLYFTRKYQSTVGLLLGLYVYLGFVVSIISHGLWHDNSLELGLKPPYEFTTRESLPFLIYLLPVIPLINVVTSYFTRGYTIKHLQKFFPNSWEQASILNALTAFAIYLIIAFSIDGFLDPFIVIYVSCLTSIVGFITYYHTMPPPWELLKSNNVKHYIEALKLEHESVWTFIKFGVELTIIVIPSAVIAWVQILYPMVPKDKQNSLQFFLSCN